MRSVLKFSYFIRLMEESWFLVVIGAWINIFMDDGSLYERTGVYLSYLFSGLYVLTIILIMAFTFKKRK